MSRPGSTKARASGKRRGIFLNIWAVVALAYLFIPIVVIVLFSFNKPKGTRNYEWNTFSLDAWRHPFRVAGFAAAFKLSLGLAALATLIAIFLGTAMSLALVKYRFKGKGFVNTLLILPLTMPEVVLGFSLLTLFVSLNVSRGFLTMLISHVMFCVSYVATTVKARIRGFDWRLEEAAADLGATPLRTFWKITFPIIAPGVFAAALLTFALSLDDFIITYLNAGTRETFPIAIWLKKRSTIPPQINVFGTMVLVVSALLAGAGLLVQRRRERLNAA
jgi:spermidine/putrescine transport system permease protein